MPVSLERMDCKRFLITVVVRIGSFHVVFCCRSEMVRRPPMVVTYGFVFFSKMFCGIHVMIFRLIFWRCFAIHNGLSVSLNTASAAERSLPTKMKLW
jgi:hypothetical protein